MPSNYQVPQYMPSGASLSLHTSNSTVHKRRFSACAVKKCPKISLHAASCGFLAIARLSFFTRRWVLKAVVIFWRKTDEHSDRQPQRTDIASAFKLRMSCYGPTCVLRSG